MSKVEDAREAFVAAVESGGTGVAEYRQWRDEWKAAQQSVEQYNADETARSNAEWDTYTKLLNEASRELTAYSHLARQRTAPGQEEDWCKRASAYAGREITRFEDHIAIPKPNPVVFKNTPADAGQEPRDYLTEVAAIAAKRTK